jgi:transposase InsO family protein
MSSSLRGTIAVGTRLSYDGQTWEVAEVSGTGVVLRDALGGIRQAGLGHLLSHPGTRLQSGDAGQQASTGGLGAAGPACGGDDDLGSRVGHVLELLTGYRRGSEALALPGEPRPQYAPGTPRLKRCEAKAAELGISLMTVRRMAWRFEADGPEGLIDRRTQRRRDPLGGADARWLDMARAVLAEHTDASKPTQNIILARIAARLESEHGAGVVPVPGQTRARALLREISKGTSAFGGTKAKREIAGRPAAPYGRLRATRPGEYLLLDTTRLDVFAMDPVTLRWVQAELTVAMDLYDRCVTGLRVTPVSTKAVDAAAVLFESVRPLPEPAAGWAGFQPPYHGLPGAVVVDAARLADENGEPLLPSVAAETIVVDHGKIYLSEHLLSACVRLGISVQPARVYQGTDKAALERFFRTLGEQLLVALPGYKGPDVYRRGKDVENQAFYFLDELERIVRNWTAGCYHRQRHAGLCVPEVPGLAMSPLEMFGHGIARAGYLQIPARADLVFDFLKVRWRTIQHYGVEVGGLRYDGPALNPYRNRTSPYAGKDAGRWPIRVDPGDVSKVWFQDPADNTFHVLRWEHASAAGGPFSSEALAYARQLAAATHRFPDTRRALAELLDQWNAGLAGNRAERRMAVRVSEHRLRLAGEPAPPDDGKAVAPAVPPGTGGQGGDDDCAEELDAPFPGEPGSGEERDFYADAMELA